MTHQRSITKKAQASTVTNTYDVVGRVTNFDGRVSSAGFFWKDIYSRPVYIPQWNSWVRGLVTVTGSRHAVIKLLHCTDADVDTFHKSPQHQHLEVLKEDRHGGHLEDVT